LRAKERSSSPWALKEDLEEKALVPGDKASEIQGPEKKALLQ